jgi:uncharacterized protein YaaR (DUF327 family)
MTTFTMQDLNQLPTTPEEDEMFKTMAEMSRETKDAMTEILHTRHVTEPQPTLTDIINTICTQLQLLTTIISQPKAQPEGGENSLQECVDTTLQQADWFKEAIKEQVTELVESEVEMYFERRFDPTDHFDFGDAVSNEVHDRIDDAVRDHIDDVVQEQLEEVVAEKLKSIRVVFD